MGGTTPAHDADALRQQRCDTYYKIGLNHLGVGRDADALAAFDALLADCPDEPRGLMGRGLALGRLGRVGEALAAAERLLAIAPDDARGYSTRAFIRQQTGRLAEARADYERAIALEPENPAHRYNFACYWAKVGDAARCRANLAEVLRRKPASHVFAAADVDFACFRDEPWFVELVSFKE